MTTCASSAHPFPPPNTDLNICFIMIIMIMLFIIEKHAIRIFVSSEGKVRLHESTKLGESNKKIFKRNK